MTLLLIHKGEAIEVGHESAESEARFLIEHVLDEPETISTPVVSCQEQTICFLPASQKVVRLSFPRILTVMVTKTTRTRKKMGRPFPNEKLLHHFQGTKDLEKQETMAGNALKGGSGWQ